MAGQPASSLSTSVSAGYNSAPPDGPKFRTPAGSIVSRVAHGLAHHPGEGVFLAVRPLPQIPPGAARRRGCATPRPWHPACKRPAWSLIERPFRE